MFDLRNIKKGKIVEKGKKERGKKYRDYIESETKKGHVGNYGVVRITISPENQYILYDGPKVIGRFNTGDEAADERERLYGF